MMFFLRYIFRVGLPRPSDAVFAADGAAQDLDGHVAQLAFQREGVRRQFVDTIGLDGYTVRPRTGLSHGVPPVPAVREMLSSK
jgi:hypothetical protein